MIGIIGGTGDLGTGLAKRLVTANHEVFIGSRSADKGEKIASELRDALRSDLVHGGSNSDASLKDHIFVTLPAESLETTLLPLRNNLSGKIVIECCVNLSFGKFIKVNTPNGKSTHEIVREFLSDSIVVSALKTVSAYKLSNLDIVLEDSDFIMTLNDEGYSFIEKIEKDIGLEPYRVRGKTHALTIERMTALAIQLNKEYRGSHFGFKLTR